MEQIEQLRKSARKFEKLVEDAVLCEGTIARLPQQIEEAKEEIESFEENNTPLNRLIHLQARLDTAPRVLEKIIEKVREAIPDFSREIDAAKSALIAASQAEKQEIVGTFKRMLEKIPVRKVGENSAKDEALADAARRVARGLGYLSGFPNDPAENQGSLSCPLFGNPQDFHGHIIGGSGAELRAADKLRGAASRVLNIATEWEKRGRRFVEPVEFK